MPSIGPVSRPDLIRSLRKAGFTGPFAGGKHSYMLKGIVRLAVPNPHRADIGVGLLLKVIKQAGMTPEEWERL